MAEPAGAAPAPRPAHRPLLWLTLAVASAHLVLLWRGAAWLQPAPEPDEPPAPTFSTRLLPPPPATPAPPRAAAPAPRPKIQPHRPQASAQRTETAPDSIASSAPPAASEGSAAAAEPAPPPDSAPALAPEPPPPEPRPPVEPAPPAALASGALPATPPPPIRLQYEVSGQVRRLPYQASGEMSWQHDGQHYEARASVSAFLIGGRSQSSRGELTPQGLAPRRFADKARSELAAHFDAEQGRVVFSANSPEAPLLPGMQDRLSLFIQLAALVERQPERFTPGTRISVPTVSAREADTWVFTVEPPETLDLPGGPEATLKLLRAPRREYDTRVELWLAPSLHHLPARIRITQANGDYADQQLRAVLPP